ncbi:four helix bundle protein [Chitinophagaceae bacterium MMS25-I14]
MSAGICNIWFVVYSGIQQNVYKGFKDLNCWKEGRVLRKMVSDFSKQLPGIEKYRRSEQLIKSSRSVTANIAEGYGRNTYNDTRHFFIQARGSVTEILDHLTVALNEEYLNQEQITLIEERREIVFKLINGYITYLDKQVLAKQKPGNPTPNSK